jgi:hypothetical protein
MLALTIRQPFASLIFRRLKLEEYRSWAPPAALAGGRLAIHAGRALAGPEDFAYLAARFPAATDSELAAWLASLPRGYVLGSVRLAGYRPVAADHWAARRYGARFAWQLADPAELPAPVWGVGQRGLWEWGPPARAG